MAISKLKGIFEGDIPLISETQVADRWGKSVRTMLRMRQDGSGPAYIKIGRSVFYLANDIAAFELASRKTTGASQ
jgi:predicted DNA-binding transcriptional regulator AlpA